MAGLICLCGVGGSVRGAARPDAAEVKAWLEKELGDGTMLPDLTAYSIRWNRELWGLPVLAAMLDGSGTSVSFGRVPDGYPAGDGLYRGSHHVNAGPPMMHTIDGIMGRDVP